MTTFTNLLDFLRFFGEGSLISRKAIMLNVVGCETTLDQYRRHFTAAGYLEHIGLGKYKLVKLPPADLYARSLRKEAYPWWREWNENKHLK